MFNWLFEVHYLKYFFQVVWMEVTKGLSEGLKCSSQIRKKVDRFWNSERENPNKASVVNPEFPNPAKIV